MTRTRRVFLPQPLREMRDAKGFKQREVIRLLDERFNILIDDSTFSRIENQPLERLRGSGDVVAALLEIYGYRPEDGYYQTMLIRSNSQPALAPGKPFPQDIQQLIAEFAAFLVRRILGGTPISQADIEILTKYLKGE